MRDRPLDNRVPVPGMGEGDPGSQLTRWMLRETSGGTNIDADSRPDVVPNMQHAPPQRRDSGETIWPSLEPEEAPKTMPALLETSLAQPAEFEGVLEDGRGFPHQDRMYSMSGSIQREDTSLPRDTMDIAQVFIKKLPDPDTFEEIPLTSLKISGRKALIRSHRPPSLDLGELWKSDEAP